MISEVIEALKGINQIEIDAIAKLLCKCSRVFIVGNGGSSALSSHFASDLLNLDVDAYCLTDNIPRLTAIINDYGWHSVYSKLLKEHHYNETDALIIISVHASEGQSEEGERWSSNLLNVAHFVRSGENGTIILMSGCNGGKIKRQIIPTRTLSIPNDEAYIVEGVLSVLTHAICHELRELL